MSLTSSENKGYTGRLMEEEFLPRVPSLDGYLPFADALHYARTHQPRTWRPTDPPLRRANDFHYMVADRLGANPDNVSLYTAVGSPLDRYHGVDGWVEYGGKRVTIDVTMNPHKLTYKANVVLHPDEWEMAATETADLLR